MHKRILLGVISVVLCMASFFGGYTFRRMRNDAPKINQSKAAQVYSLLAKRLFLEDPNDTIINFSGLREQMRDYLESNNLKGSIYFEYLPTGTSIRLNGDEELVAASLMKIPVVMELYKAAEQGSINLDTVVTLKQEWLDSAFGTLYQKGAGYRLTLRQAAEIALEQSDNTAVAAILASTQSLLRSENHVLNSLDVSYSRDEQKTLSISARAYSSFLKCLYFSCYLQQDDSQEILGYLTQSSFDSRLRSGVPKDVVIAHKIGTYSNKTQSDCGLVYEPKRNYLICVMLYVADDAASNAHIAKISELAYAYIKKSEPTRP